VRKRQESPSPLPFSSPSPLPSSSPSPLPSSNSSLEVEGVLEYDVETGETRNCLDQAFIETEPISSMDGEDQSTPSDSSGTSTVSGSRSTSADLAEKAELRTETAETSVLRQGPESSSVLREGPEPTLVLREGPEPTFVLREGPEPSSVLREGPELTSVLREGPDSTSVLREGPQPVCIDLEAVKSYPPVGINVAGSASLRGSVISLMPSDQSRLTPRANPIVAIPARARLLTDMTNEGHFMSAQNRTQHLEVNEGVANRDGSATRPVKEFVTSSGGTVVDVTPLIKPPLFKGVPTITKKMLSKAGPSSNVTGAISPMRKVESSSFRGPKSE